MLLLGFAKHHHGLHIDLLARLVYVMYDGFAGFVPVEESACPVFVFQRFRALAVEGVADVFGGDVRIRRFPVSLYNWLADQEMVAIY